MNPRRAFPLASVLLLLGFAAAPPAHTPLGGLIKKKVTETVVNGAVQGSPKVPTLEDVVLDLTPVRLAGWMKGAPTSQRFNETPDGPPLSIALRQPVSRKLDEVHLTYSEDLNDYYDRLATIKLMTDFARAQAEAQQRGDTAALNRLFKEFEARFDPAPAEMAELERNCGGVPAQPAYAKEAKVLEDQLAKVDQALNKALEELHQVQETESRLQRAQYVTALERLCAYVARAEKKEAQQGFSSLELHALKEKHAEAIKACAKGWN